MNLIALMETHLLPWWVLQNLSSTFIIVLVYIFYFVFLLSLCVVMCINFISVFEAESVFFLILLSTFLFCLEFYNDIYFNGSKLNDRRYFLKLEHNFTKLIFFSSRLLFHIYICNQLFPVPVFTILLWCFPSLKLTKASLPARVSE